jgi:hypothetical protein
MEAGDYPPKPHAECIRPNCGPDCIRCPEAGQAIAVQAGAAEDAFHGPLTPVCATIDTADHVRHGPTGETWLVARVHGEYLYPCGWPPSRADLHDCTLVKKASPAERQKLLQELATGQGEHAEWAKDRLVPANSVSDSRGPDIPECEKSGPLLQDAENSIEAPEAGLLSNLHTDEPDTTMAGDE